MESKDTSLKITPEAETIDVFLSPSKTPVAYEKKIRELTDSSGMSKAEAEKYLLQPIELELFYDYDRGVFAVEAEAVGATPIFNPYTGDEIPEEEN